MFTCKKKQTHLRLGWPVNSPICPHWKEWCRKYFHSEINSKCLASLSIQAKSIQEFGWPSQGMNSGWGQGIESTTHRRVKEFGYSCHQRCLTWAKVKKNWIVAQWSKVLFSDESKFCISFGNQGPRVWRKVKKLIAQVTWSPVLSFHSLWWFGVQCHLLVLVFESQRHCTHLPIHFGALHASFCWPAF